MLQYFFTKFGDVYAGYEFFESEFPEYTIIIQANKLNEYKQLKNEDKTLDTFAKYGRVVSSNMIEVVFNSNEFIPPQKEVFKSNVWDNSFQRKTMFVFGAGASANCVYGSDKAKFENDVLRPPVREHLFEKKFENIYTKYKAANFAVDYLNDEFGSSIEEILDMNWDYVKLYGDIHNQLQLRDFINIHYYLHELFNTVSNNAKTNYSENNLYAKLIEKLNDISKETTQQFAFISFNQDNIVEHFISKHSNTQLNSIDDYVNINKNSFCIFKPNGSFDWGWQFPDATKFKGDAAQWLYENNINHLQLYFNLLGNENNMIDWTNGFGYEAIIDENGIGKFTIDKSQMKLIKPQNQADYFPAFLSPCGIGYRTEFIMPPQHFFTMQHYINHIETLVVIGWAGFEEAFNKLLLTNGNKIKKVIIANPKPQLIKENLKLLLSKNNITPIVYNSFEDFVLNGIDKELN